MSSQISLFEKVQSDFLGLECTATCDELLEVSLPFSPVKL